MAEINVYQSELTGHWIVDKAGTKERPGSPSRREGFRRHADAIAEAARLGNEKRAMYARLLNTEMVTTTLTRITDLAVETGRTVSDIAAQVVDLIKRHGYGYVIAEEDHEIHNDVITADAASIIRENWLIPLGACPTTPTRQENQMAPCGRDGEPLLAQPTCTCDSPGGSIPHRPECELNHPYHPCDDRSCRFAPTRKVRSAVFTSHGQIEDWAERIIVEVTGQQPTSSTFDGDCHGLYVGDRRTPIRYGERVEAVIDNGVVTFRAAPAQAEPRVWRVVDGPDDAGPIIGVLYRQNGDTWEWQGQTGGWFPSAGTRAEMLSESYVLSEVTNQAGEA